MTLRLKLHSKPKPPKLNRKSLTLQDCKRKAQSHKLEVDMQAKLLIPSVVELPALPGAGSRLMLQLGLSETRESLTYPLIFVGGLRTVSFGGFLQPDPQQRILTRMTPEMKEQGISLPTRL